MATYRSYEELKGLCLKKNDIVYFNERKYKVGSRFLTGQTCVNEQIFLDLGLNKYEIANITYGYRSHSGDWPECADNDYAALTRLVICLFCTLKEKSNSRICYWFSTNFANKYSKELQEYFDNSDIKRDGKTFNGTVYDCYYWYSDKKIIKYRNKNDIDPTYSLQNVESKLLLKIKPLNTKENENRFQKRSPQVRGGTLPGGSAISGKRSKTSTSVGYLSHRKVFGC